MLPLSASTCKKKEFGDIWPNPHLSNCDCNCQGCPINGNFKDIRACLWVEEALVGVSEALAPLALVSGDELSRAPSLLVEDWAALVAERAARVVLALALVLLRG